MIELLVLGLFGVVALAGGVIGWFAAKTSSLERFLLGGAGMMLVHTGTLTDVIGFGVIATIVIKQKIRVRQSKLATPRVLPEEE